MKVFSFILSCIVSIICSHAFGQLSAELKADTVFVTTEGPVEIKFPGDILNVHLVDPNAPYSISSVGRSVQMRAKSDVSECARAVVDEGKRKHTLILCYRKDLNIDNLNESFFNYATVKDLQARVSQMEERTRAAFLRAESFVPAEKEQAIRDNEIKVDAQAVRVESQPSTLLRNEAVKNLLLSANSAEKAGNYEEALDWYNEVIKIDSNHSIAKAQIKIIEGKIKNKRATEESKRNETDYNETLNLGIGAKNRKDYKTAIAEFEKALKYKDNDPAAAAFLSESKRLLREETYSKVIYQAKELNKNGLFENAEQIIQRLLDIEPENAEALSVLRQIKIDRQKAFELKDRLEAKRRQDEYFHDLTKTVDSLLNIWDYEAANKAYEVGLDFSKNDLDAIKRMNEIRAKLEKFKAEEDARTKKLKIEEDDRTFKTLSQSADSLFDIREYEASSLAYDLVINFRRGDLHAKQRIGEIQIILKVQKAKKEKLDKDLEDINSQLKREEKKKNDSIERAYDFSMKEGKIKFDKNDYGAAQVFFVKALEAKPKNKDAAEWLAITTIKINDENYKKILKIADSTYKIGKNIENTLTWYEKAAELKPEEEWPRVQIKKIRDELLMKEIGKDLSDGYDRAITIYNIAEKFKTEGKFREAYIGYVEFLSKVDTLKIELYSETQHVNITNAMDSRKRLFDFRPIQVVDPKIKYADIDFSIPPAEQIWNKKLIKFSKQPDFIKTEVLSQPSKPLSVESFDKLKFTCDLIKFVGQNVYFRIVIQNNDTSEFVTGPIILKQTKNRDEVIKTLYPGLVNDYPLIYPGQQGEIVFGMEELSGLPGETIVFEIKERITQKIYTLHLAWDMYARIRSGK